MSILYLLIFTWHFFVPGFLIAKLFGIKDISILLGFSISYFLMLIVLAPLKYFGGPVDVFVISSNTIVIVTFVAYIWTRVSLVGGGVAGKEQALPGFDTKLKGRISVDKVWLIGAGAFVLLAAAMYLLWAGPYLEVPSDAWHHAGDFQKENGYLQRGELPGFDRLELVFSKYAGYWYFIHAYMADLAGLSIEESFTAAAFATNMSFLLAVYVFSVFVLDRQETSSKLIALIAAISVLFYVLHFGVNIFSYIRYYALAPTIMSFVLYLALTGLVIKYLKGEGSSLLLISTCAVIFLVILLIHPQEALFSVVIFVSLTLVYGVAAYSYRNADNESEHWANSYFSDQNVAINRIRVLCIVVTIAILVVFVYSHINIERNNPLKYGRMISVETILPFVKNLYILDPTRDFYQVLTLWGVFVYVGFGIFFKEVRRYPYMLAGMAVPIITVFNPIFTDLFLRFLWPEVLWRICLVVPLPLVGAYIVFRMLKIALGKKGRPRAVVSAIGVVGLLGALLPFDSTYVENKYSRIYTLEPVKEENGYEYWSDLFAYLRSVGTKKILTDPVTGYMVKGLTNKEYDGHKFHRIDYNRINYESYDETTFRKYAGEWFLVINVRDGGGSRNGRISGHWPENVLKVSEYYSKELIDFVSNRPDLFKEQWHQEGVYVYKIMES